MAILIDRPRWSWHGVTWSHLVSDESISELHQFARSIRMRYLSFQGDHYDVPEPLFDRALATGATLVDSRELVKRLRESGLRRRTGKSATAWNSVAEGELASVGTHLIRRQQATAEALGLRFKTEKLVTLLARPAEQVLLFRLGTGEQVLAAGVERLDENTAIVEAHDARGHSLEIVWRLGAGRELDHR